MMNSLGLDWRERRNVLNQTMSFTPMMHYRINYSTDHKKSESNPTFAEESLLSKLNFVSDPLKKNLADSVITTQDKPAVTTTMPPDTKDYYYPANMPAESVENAGNHQGDSYSPLTGITKFFSAVIGAFSNSMFHRRSKSPVSQYHDCFDQDSDSSHERSPSLSWQASNMGDQNKNGRGTEQFGSTPSNDNMNNCRVAVAQCENKINAVRDLLTTKNVSKPAQTQSRLRRRPRRVFVEPSSVEDSFEDAFAPEDFVCVANKEYIEYFSCPNISTQELCEVDSEKVKTEVGPLQKTMEAVNIAVEIDEKCLVSPKVESSVNSGDKLSNEEPASSENVIASADRRTLPQVDDKSVIPQSDVIPKHILDTNVTQVTKSMAAETTVKQDSVPDKKQIISSCEDKIARLKSMLLEKRKKNTRTTSTLADSAPDLAKEIVNTKKPAKIIMIDKTQDKRFKNPNRLATDKRKQSKLRNTIQEDLLFAHEIDSEEISSVESSPKVLIRKKKSSNCSVLERKQTSSQNSEQPQKIVSKNNIKQLPGSVLQKVDQSTPELSNPQSCAVEDVHEYFDEIKGRFRSTSTTDSEDSFQIVFSDSPNLSRKRIPSDCDSEDSFIVFEDSPDSCYTSNNMFGDETESDSDTESDVSDSGCGTDICKLAHSFSRTVSDLTDDSLFDGKGDDEVDCAVRTFEEVPDDEIQVNEEVRRPGLLLTEARKQQKKEQPAKNVSFSSVPPKVHVMRVWAFAARQARMGDWQRVGLDRDRFKRRIADVDMAVSWVLKPQHRSRVMFQRFMPWWNAQKRQELAEKKQREAEEKEKARIKEEEEKTREAAKVTAVDKDISDLNGVEDKKGEANKVSVVNQDFSETTDDLNSSEHKVVIDKVNLDLTTTNDVKDIAIVNGNRQDTEVGTVMSRNNIDTKVASKIEYVNDKLVSVDTNVNKELGRVKN